MPASAAHCSSRSLGVRHAGVGEARQAVEARQVGRGGVAQEVLRRAVHIGGRAHVEGAAADAIHERRAAPRELVHDEAAERLGVAHHDGRRDGGRRRGAQGGRRRIDERDVQLGAGDDLVNRLLRVHERRIRHGVAAEAARLTTQRRHITHLAQAGGAVSRGQQRLAGTGQHGGELRQVAGRGRHVSGQAHGHDEVDVSQVFAERRHALDVGRHGLAALAAVGIDDVDAVRPGAEVAVAVPELQAAQLAAPRVAVAAARPRLQREAARRRLQRGVHQGGRDAGARPPTRAPASARSSRASW